MEDQHRWRRHFGSLHLWEAMNIRSVGPALYLASQAASKDGWLDFVCAREEDRLLFMEYLEARPARADQKSSDRRPQELIR